MKRVAYQAVLLSLALGAIARAEPPAPPQSPTIAEDGQVTLQLRAPQAKEVAVSGQVTAGKGKGKGMTAMVASAAGTWAVTVGPLQPGIYEYSFIVDGVQMLDPGNSHFKPQQRPQSSFLEIPAKPPALTEFQDVPHGTVRVHDYKSKALGRVRRLHVYTPPGYDGMRTRLPTLYLLHGLGDNDASWSSFGRAPYILDNLIAQGKARPMVIVMTDGHPLLPDARSFRERLTDNAEAYERELMEDVLPLIAAQYRVRADADGRAIVGLSMGGHQALTVGLRHPDKFAWIGAFSAVAPSESSVAAALAGGKAFAKKLRWLWIGCGKDDSLLKGNEDFVALLRSKGIEPTWRLTEGNHSWPIWRGYFAQIVPDLFTGSAQPAH